MADWPIRGGYAVWASPDDHLPWARPWRLPRPGIAYFAPGAGTGVTRLRRQEASTARGTVLACLQGWIESGDGLLRAFAPRSEEGQKVGGVRVAIVIDIAIRRAPCRKQIQQIGGVHIAIPIEIGRAVGR
jgi:hypothetical protein